MPTLSRAAVRASTVFSAALLSVAALAAQGVVRDVPSNSPGSGTCSTAPFGNGTAATANQRLQFVVTRNELGSTAGWITGLSFAPCAGGLSQAEFFEIGLGLLPSGFGFTGHLDFDDNLWNQCTVWYPLLSSEFNARWSRSANAWSTIGADASVWYDGTSDLLVDIKAIGNRASGGNSGVHHDGRPALHVAGWTGPMPATGTVVNTAPKVRVQFGVADKAAFNVGCHGLALALAGNAVPGQTIHFDVTGGGANLPVVLNLGITSPDIELGVIYIPGCWFLSDLAITSIVSTTDASGARRFSLTLPTSNSLNGARVIAQGVHANPALPQFVATSNGYRFVIGPAQP
ncbi:MAG: hypothetical protein IT457_21975 [Planctomycetes bacterium]|nr:hypothetical protein [Planctomycetota bacterium]